MATQQIKYQIGMNMDRMVVLYEHVDPTGIKRIETAIVKTDMPVSNLNHLQTAFDAFFGRGKGHSTVSVKRSHTVTIEGPEPEPKKIEGDITETSEEINNNNSPEVIS